MCQKCESGEFSPRVAEVGNAITDLAFGGALMMITPAMRLPPMPDDVKGPVLDEIRAMLTTAHAFVDASLAYHRALAAHAQGEDRAENRGPLDLSGLGIKS